MGTEIEIAVIPNGFQAASTVSDQLQLARAELVRLESMLSRFVPTSDVSRVNERPDTWVDVHPETAAVLALAKRGYEVSDGLFHPCLGGWMVAHGYQRSFDLGLDAPYLDMPDTPPALPDSLGFELSGMNIRLRSGYALDLGGIAKGWVMERIADLLRGFGYVDFVCSAGGDMVCAGTNGDAPWNIGIADPLGRTSHVCTVQLTALALATSGTYRRRWTVGETTYHHILDPRTGAPSDTDLASVSVIHQSLVVAEVLAKTALILGRASGVEWLSAQTQRGWVVVTREGEVHHAWNS